MSTITTIQANDLITNSRAVINTNLSNLNTDKMETSVLDTDVTLTANSDSKVATQKAVKAYADTQIGIKTIFMGHLSNGMQFSFYSDVLAVTAGRLTSLSLEVPGSPTQQRTVTADMGTADICRAVAIQGGYLYALLGVTGTGALGLYRYALANLAAAGTLMTFSGQATGTSNSSTQFTISDSGIFYFTSKAGNSASQHIVSKYTLSGTILTYDADVTCGSTSGNFDMFARVDDSGNIYGMNSSTKIIRKYNSSGTLQATSSTYLGAQCANIAGVQYIGTEASMTYAQTGLPA